MLICKFFTHFYSLKRNPVLNPQMCVQLIPWHRGWFCQELSSPHIRVPVWAEAENPSKHERVNCVPLGLDVEGVTLRECSMLNGPLQILAWHWGLFFQILSFPHTMVPVWAVAVKPSMQARLNSVPDGLVVVGLIIRECSMLNGPVHMLATSKKKHNHDMN